MSFTANGKRNFNVLESQNRDNRSQCDAPRDCCLALIAVTLMNVNSSNASFL